MRKFSTKTKLFGTIIILFVSSCTPATRLAGFLHRHPELVKKDTILQKVAIDVPAIKIDTTIHLVKDDSKLMDLIDSYKGKIDSALAVKLKAQIKYITLSSKVIPDTVTILQDGLTIRAWEQEGGLKLHIDKPKQVITKEVPLSISSVEVKDSRTWWEKFELILDRIMGIVCAIFLMIQLFKKVKSP